MKKLLIIAVASCFTFISCSKVEPTPESQPANVSEVKQQSPIVKSTGDANCFTITNLETIPGVVEYILQYTDCYGNEKKVSLREGQFLSDCIQSGTVRTNFAYAIIACR